MSDRNWWRQASFYQIYPRSFFDANNDGEGDLRGITGKVSYLSALGIDAVWLSPFYPSPLADGGYDISNPRDVDPRFGTLADFDDLIETLHRHDIRVVVDVVPNHVSIQHPWFVEAVEAGAGSAARNRFHFRDGRGADGSEPPNNWQSVFGGSAWTRIDGEQWYLHLFDSSQPDVNWTNPEVVEDGLKTLQFWLDRGVDGFRVDVAFGLMKDMTYADHHDPRGLINAMRLDLYDPERDPALPNPREVLLGGPFFDRDEVHEIYRGWRKLLDSYTPTRMTVAEAWAYPASRAMAYARSDELHQVFNFDFMVTPFRADAIRRSVNEVLETVQLVNAPATWVLSNHDSPRVVSRFGGGVEGLKRARVMAMVAHALPGGVYVFAGEELGLADAEIPADAHQDPIWFRTNGAELGRDGCRVPLPWQADRPNYGFSAAEKLWLPQPSDWSALAVDNQDGNPESTLTMYRNMLDTRRRVVERVDENDFEWLSTSGEVVAFQRGNSLRVIANISTNDVDLTPWLTGWELSVVSQQLLGSVLSGSTAVWLVPSGAQGAKD